MGSRPGDDAKNPRQEMHPEEGVGSSGIRLEGVRRCRGVALAPRILCSTESSRAESLAGYFSFSISYQDLHIAEKESSGAGAEAGAGAGMSSQEIEGHEKEEGILLKRKKNISNSRAF